MATAIHLGPFARWLISFATLTLIAYTVQAQSKNPALDSMGANMGKQNWKDAMQWALKAAEADPKEKYWRFLNAADLASRDKNVDLAGDFRGIEQWIP